MKEATTALSRREKMRKQLFRITLTGILISLGMVTKLATEIPIPVLGPGGMKIGFSGIFTALPAFLFGPLYGGLASAMSDLIGAIVTPDGAYIPWLTVTAFLGGCIKGLLWKLLVKAEGRKGGAVFLAVFVLIGALGCGNYFSLRADGVVDSVITTKESVPTKDIVSSMELSPMSDLATKLATYQNDTLTVTEVPTSDSVTIPAFATVGKFRYSVKKIGAGVFASCSEPLVVTLPPAITGIDNNAFGDLKQVTILSPTNKTVADFCEEHGYTYTVTNTQKNEQAVESGTNLTGGGYSFSSNHTYRKYLSGYLNFMTFGLMLISLVGILTSMLLLVFSKKPAAILLMRVAIACITSGVIVTTVNTEILRHFLAAYQGRAFLILWIPRLIEEIVVCLIQSYLIFLLLGVYETKIKPKISALLKV